MRRRKPSGPSAVAATPPWPLQGMHIVERICVRACIFIVHFTFPSVGRLSVPFLFLVFVPSLPPPTPPLSLSVRVRVCTFASSTCPSVSLCLSPPHPHPLPTSPHRLSTRFPPCCSVCVGVCVVHLECHGVAHIWQPFFGLVEDGQTTLTTTGIVPHRAHTQSP